jgi:hypothetical protein
MLSEMSSLPKLKSYTGIPIRGAVIANNVHVPGWLEIDTDDDYDIFRDAAHAAMELSPGAMAYLPEVDMFAPFESFLAKAWAMKYGYRVMIPDPRKFKTLADALRAAERHNTKNASQLFMTEE